jgi:hypothetical protein
MPDPKTEAYDLDLEPLFDEHVHELDKSGAYYGLGFGDFVTKKGVGSVNYPADWIGDGKNGLHIKCNGSDLYPRRAYQSGQEAFWGNALALDSTCGDYVLIEDAIIHCGNEGVFVGFDRWASPIPGTQTVEFRNCYFKADTPMYPGMQMKWAVNSWDTNLIYRGCTWETGSTVEHASYSHGFAKTPIPGTELVISGSFMEDCRIKNCGAEGWKFPRRPHTIYYDQSLNPNAFSPGGKYHNHAQGQHYQEHPVVLARRCRVEGFAQPHSWRGGAGMTFSGTGAHIILEGCAILNGANPEKPCFSALVEGEYFDSNGECMDERGRNRLGIRQVQLKDSLFAFDYDSATRGGYPLPIVTAQNCELVTIERCGIFGDGDIRARESSEVILKGCNTDAIRQKAIEHYPEIAGKPDAKWLSYDGGLHTNIREDLHYQAP